ncbi:flavin reductase family protein [Aestuariicella hydrocarbonica]|uniref:Flavin reductase family protein n=1 Tax=Pseudomaricurvus hydrocarbonicus TaxID=1470433 RepID=A0A9E5MQ46_9GAMM|nr:flavin reductase family protein [Aestuariicella hydrocarbonica]NHO68391.1 flavin reductase family protein [Aestuariicella hydrocarbonica]
MIPLDNIHSYRVGESSLPHDPISSIIGPRPIGWISTLSVDGIANLAPYSFFTVVNYQPPMVMFSSVTKKDSVTNAEQTGEFVVNLATRALAEKINLSSSALLPEQDEIQFCGLTPAPSLEIKPPRVAESPVSLECRVTRIEPLLGLNSQTLDTWVTYGEVVAVNIDNALLKNGIFDTSSAGIILRAGGPADYFEVLAEGKFQMHRPR